MSSIPDVVNLPVPVPRPEAASHSTLTAAQIGIFAIACGLTVANIFFTQPLIGLIGPALGLAASRIGLIVTLTQVGYGIGLLLLVPLSDVLENRRLVVMALCAQEMLRRGQLKKKTVVATVMSNLGLEHALNRDGAKLVRTAVGDRYVVEAMRQHGYNLGGEQSGHLIFLGHASTGDGTVAALQVLAIMLSSGKPLSELAALAMVRVPQVLENVTLGARKALEDMKTLSALSAKITHELGDNGRVLIRWSGTEPKLRIMLEGPDEDRIKKWSKELAGAAKADAG